MGGVHWGIAFDWQTRYPINNFNIPWSCFTIIFSFSGILFWRQPYIYSLMGVDGPKNSCPVMTSVLEIKCIWHSGKCIIYTGYSYLQKIMGFQGFSGARWHWCHWRVAMFGDDFFPQSVDHFSTEVDRRGRNWSWQGRLPEMEAPPVIIHLFDCKWNGWFKAGLWLAD